MRSKKTRNKSLATENVSDEESEIDYCLDRLFDPEQLYYVPMKELVKRYKKRSLIPGRVYNLAKKYGFVEDSRERKIQAPQMRRANQRIYGNENFYDPPPKVFYCTLPNNLDANRNGVGTSDSRHLNDEISSSSDESGGQEEEETKLSYEERMRDRRMLRKSLNKLDLDYEYLKRKKDLTEIERRVLNRLMYCEKAIQTDPVVEKRVLSKTPPPKIEYPTPGAMERIEKFLNENKWRLVDLFKDLDKNKDWRVKREDLKRECRKGRLDINDSMIEELVTVLGKGKANKINYKSLAKGRHSHLSELRAQLRESRESLQSGPENDDDEDEDEDEEYAYSRRSPPSPPVVLRSPPILKQQQPRNIESGLKQTASNIRSPYSDIETRVVAASILSNNDSKSSSSFTKSPSPVQSASQSPNYLQLPKIDFRPEKYSNQKTTTTTTTTIRFRDQTTSAHSVFVKEATEPIKPRSDGQKTLQISSSPMFENQRNLARLRENDFKQFEKCLQKTRHLFESDLTLKRGYLNPADVNRQEILAQLKHKEEIKKENLRKASLKNKKKKSKESV